jgi:hypothetical protein
VWTFICTGGIQCHQVFSRRNEKPRLLSQVHQPWHTTAFPKVGTDFGTELSGTGVRQPRRCADADLRPYEFVMIVKPEAAIACNARPQQPSLMASVPSGLRSVRVRWGDLRPELVRGLALASLTAPPLRSTSATTL